MNIGSIFLELLADAARLQPQVVAEAEKAGEAGGRTLGQKLGAGLKQYGVKAFALAFSGAAAVVTKGAAQMENATNRFASETGASFDEAKARMAAANQVAGEYQMSLDDVADAAIRVKRDLGATGEEADQLTAQFAEYARVTKQDVVGAVEDYDDILDSWGLTAKDARRIQDQLLVSQQKFGGSIKDNQKTLAALAPSMRAANFEIEDGIALLGLFGAKGLDANTASAAFAKALTKVKSPEELKFLIEDISNTVDPFERAEKAAELFGARAGAKLANALGDANLDDFTISMGEAAGATERANDALDRGFGPQLRKKISEIGAAIRGLGADYGPVLTGAASLASLGTALGLDKVLGEAWKKAAGSAVVTKAVAAASSRAATVYLAGLIAGDKITSALTGFWNKLPMTGAKAAGTRAGTAFTAGLALGLVGLAGLVGKALVDAIQPFADEQIGKVIATRNIEMLKEARKILQTQLQGSKLLGFVDFDPFGMTDGTKKNLAAIEASIAELERSTSTGLDSWVNDMSGAGAMGAQAFGKGIEDNADAVVPGMRAMGASVLDSVDQVGPLAKALGQKIPPSIAEGILAEQNEVVDAMGVLKHLMENELTPAQEIARNIGILTSKELAEGLKDKRPAVRAEAERVQAIAEQRLAELIVGGGKVGKKAGEELKQGLKSKNPAIRAAAERVREIVKGKLDKIPPAAGKAGTKAGNTLMANFIRAVNSKGVVTIKVRTSDSTIGGRASGGAVAAATPYWINENTPRTELFVPSTSGYVMTNAQAVRTLKDALGGGGGGNTYNVPVSVQGALPVTTIRDISREVQRAARLGAVPPRTLAPQYDRRAAR